MAHQMNTTGLFERRINIIQGEQQIGSGPETVLTTILGSCVAACLWDPAIGVGGMNHFLLPGDATRTELSTLHGNALRYGVHSMELLVNGLLQKGAQRGRLQAKLFGGARMTKGLTDIGELNAAFGERFLRTEGITIAGGSLRGDRGRRIQFWPYSGRARQIFIGSDSDVMRDEQPVQPTQKFNRPGTVELF